MKPLTDVDIAFLQLEFAIRLLSFCDLGKIDPDYFDLPHTTELKEGNIHFPSGNFKNKNDLIAAASITVNLALAATALALDEAFSAKGITRDPMALDNNSQTRILIYMIRNAYAHGISDPRWEVKSSYQREINIRLNEYNSIHLDLRERNGQPFRFEQLGGHANWLLLKDLATGILEQA
jgi:hypothetical protein